MDAEQLPGNDGDDYVEAPAEREDDAGPEVVGSAEHGDNVLKPKSSKGKAKMTDAEAELHAQADAAQDKADALLIQREFEGADDDDDMSRSDPPVNPSEVASLELARELQSAEWEKPVDNPDHGVDMSHHDTDLRNSGIPAASRESTPLTNPAPTPPAVPLTEEESALARRAEITRKANATKARRKQEKADQARQNDDAMDVDTKLPAAPAPAPAKRKAPRGPSKAAPKAGSSTSNAPSTAASTAASSVKRPRAESQGSALDAHPPKKKVVPARPQPLMLKNPAPRRRTKKAAPPIEDDEDDGEESHAEDQLHPTFGEVHPPSDS